MTSPTDAEVQEKLRNVTSELLEAIEGGSASLTTFASRWSQLQATLIEGVTSSSFSAPTLELAGSVAEAVYHVTGLFLHTEEEGNKAQLLCRANAEAILKEHSSTPFSKPVTKPSSSSSKDASGPKKPVIPTAELVKLRDWFLGNIGNPYLTAAQKQQMIKGTSLDVAQLNNWVNNQRRRSGWTELLKKHADNDKAKMRDLCHRAFIQPDPKNLVPEDVMKDLMAMRDHLSSLYRSEVAQWWPAAAKMIKNTPAASGKGTIGWERKEKLKAEKRAWQEARQKRREEKERRHAEKARRKAILAALRQQKIAAVTKPPAYDLRYALPLDFPARDLPIPSSSTTPSAKRKRIDDAPSAPLPTSSETKAPTQMERPLKRARLSAAAAPPQPRHLKSPRSPQPASLLSIQPPSPSDTITTVSSDVTPKTTPTKRKRDSDELDASPTPRAITTRPTKRLRFESTELSASPSPSCSPASDSSSLPSLSSGSVSSPESRLSSPLLGNPLVPLGSLSDKAEFSLSSYLDELSSILATTDETVVIPQEPVAKAPMPEAPSVDVYPLEQLLNLDFALPDSSQDLTQDVAALCDAATGFDWRHIGEQPFPNDDETNGFKWLADQIGIYPVDSACSSVSTSPTLKHHPLIATPNISPLLESSYSTQPTSLPLTPVEAKQRLTFTGLSSGETRPSTQALLQPNHHQPATKELGIDPSLLSCPQ